MIFAKQSIEDVWQGSDTSVSQHARVLIIPELSISQGC